MPQDFGKLLVNPRMSIFKIRLDEYHITDSSLSGHNLIRLHTGFPYKTHSAVPNPFCVKSEMSRIGTTDGIHNDDNFSDNFQRSMRAPEQIVSALTRSLGTLGKADEEWRNKLSAQINFPY